MTDMNPTMEQPERPPRTRRAPLDEFLYHQRRAMSETGRALLGLLPKDFRTHADNALRESKVSWEALVDGAIDAVQEGLDKLRCSPREDTGKVEIEVE